MLIAIPIYVQYHVSTYSIVLLFVLDADTSTGLWDNSPKELLPLHNCCYFFSFSYWKYMLFQEFVISETWYCISVLLSSVMEHSGSLTNYSSTSWLILHIHYDKCLRPLCVGGIQENSVKTTLRPSHQSPKVISVLFCSQRRPVRISLYRSFIILLWKCTETEAHRRFYFSTMFYILCQDSRNHDEQSGWICKVSVVWISLYWMR